nr:PREDICTED: uncharacterized protein LOC102358764 [Latimeria chalumnae]|eukprot:XP_014344412.1 PREDICTED: uncharacterized protein LOC102358764 [Latimeria chalumnae]
MLTGMSPSPSVSSYGNVQKDSQTLVADSSSRSSLRRGSAYVSNEAEKGKAGLTEDASLYKKTDHTKSGSGKEKEAASKSRPAYSFKEVEEPRMEIFERRNSGSMFIKGVTWRLKQPKSSQETEESSAKRFAKSAPSSGVPGRLRPGSGESEESRPGALIVEKKPVISIPNSGAAWRQRASSKATEEPKIEVLGLDVKSGKSTNNTGVVGRLKLDHSSKEAEEPKALNISLDSKNFNASSSR